MIHLITYVYAAPAPGPGTTAAPRGVGGPAVRPRPPRHPVRLRPRRPRLRPARSLLRKPLNTRSAILDVGYADTIPDAIRKAVIARTKAAPGPAASTAAPPTATSTTSTQTPRRQDQHHRLRPALPVPPRHLRPPPRLGPRAPARRIHPRHQPRRQTSPPQPRTTTSPTSGSPRRLTPDPVDKPNRREQRAARDRKPPHRPRAPARPDATGFAFTPSDEKCATVPRFTAAQPGGSRATSSQPQAEAPRGGTAA